MNTQRSIVHAPHIVLAAAGATLALVGAAAAQQQPPIALLPLQQNKIYLDAAAPPDTVQLAQPDWDYFAWNSFMALNWPALETTPNRFRGVPDLSKSFAMASNSDLAVWETFQEKREIFNQLSRIGQLAWYSPVNYGPLRQGSVSVPPGMRVFHQNSGATTPPNGLDETVEVKSQALEPTYPDGTPNPVVKAIPPVVTPRVWRGLPSAKNPIVYEVKLNYDYFNYIVSYTPSPLNVDNSQPNNPVAMAAAGALIHLPARTSSAQGLGGKNPLVLNYRAGNVRNSFQNINDVYHGLKPPPAPLPPRQGAMQVKAAWVKLGGPNAKPSDFPTWHTAFAQYYVADPASGNPVPSEPSLFGLVGMHIIQRIHTTAVDSKHPAFPSAPNANPPGGTFIFATWEHDSIFNSPVRGQKNPPKPTYFYSNFFAGESVEHGLKKGFYPPLDQAFPVERRYPVLDNTKKATALVHSLIRSKNPNSVWLHYHLVGTQFQAVNLTSPDGIAMPPNDPTRIGQPAFLANLAIETNLGLQFFQGQPPTTTVIGNYLRGPTNPNGPLGNNNTATFARENANTAFNGKGFNMGGCMGCHGVAQSRGFSFSFVLLDGYVGAVTDTQEHFNQ
jgi:hypothetical protein